MDFYEQVTQTIMHLTEALGQAKNVITSLHERIIALENRQDTLWRALQGITEHLSKEKEDGERA